MINCIDTLFFKVLLPVVGNYLLEIFNTYIGASDHCLLSLFIPTNLAFFKVDLKRYLKHINLAEKP